VLYSVARAQTNAQSSEDVSPSWENESQPDNHVLLKKPWKTLFDLELPEGQCIGVRIDAQNSCDELSNEAIASSNHWIHACLHPDEVKYAMSQPSEYTRETFLLGRLAMRQMLSQSGPILKDDHGRPNVPMLYLGSISHKRSIANGTTGVALLAPRVKDTGVGVDIELAFSNRRSIAKRVLTENEINELGRIEGVSKDEEVLLRFSLKEAFYKAIHPLICQYVGFQEAEVRPESDGTASVRWNLKSGADKRFKTVTGHWRRIDEFFLSSACVTLHDTVQDECIMKVNQSQ
jgi:phosphopantetheine--protein transferase-like protein